MKMLAYSIRTLLVMFVFFALTTSCKKENDSKPGFVVEGKWQGKIGTDPAVPISQFSLNLKSGGVLERINSGGTVSGTGTWSVNGDQFIGNYTLNSGTSIQLFGTVKKNINQIDGTWINNGGETGKWFLNTRL